MTIPSEYRSERVGLSPAEKGKQDRRIGSAIKQGMPMARIRKSYAVTEARVREVAAIFDLEIVKARQGGKRC